MAARTRFLVISDTHNATPDPFPPNKARPFRHPLPKADVLLHCGDITMSGKLSEYETALTMLGRIDAELKLVIAGNHDRTLDAFYFRKNLRYGEKEEDHERAVEMWKGPRAAKAGVTYLDEGMHNFTLKSGATFSLYASPYQPEFCNWAFPYERDEDRFNPPDPDRKGHKFVGENVVPDFPAVDVMMTHGPPLHRLDRTARGDDVGCEHLLRAVCRARPRIACFGHIHEAWGAEWVNWDGKASGLESSIESISKEKVDLDKVVQDRAAFVDGSSSARTPIIYGGTTLLINAAIMDVWYKPVNAPWVVDLDLPLRAEPDGHKD